MLPLIQFQPLVIITVVLIGMMSVQGSDGRGRRSRLRHAQLNVSDSQCLRQLRHRFLFVQNVLHASNDTQTSGRINFVTGARAGSRFCPWTWAIDEDVDRIPRYLAKAECPKCHVACRAVFYSHNALVQRCTRRTGGNCIWKRMERTLAVAYVYDP